MPGKKSKSVRIGKDKLFKMVNPEKIVANEWNPNEMSPDQYNLLIDNIMKVGFGDPLMVTPYEDEDDPNVKYMVVDGEHRWKAALDVGLTRIPVIVAEDYDEVTAKKQTIRMNKIKGDLNHKKFNRMIENMLKANELDLDTAAFELGFADEEEFALFRAEARKMLPKEARPEFDKRAKGAQDIDDIYTIVMLLMKKYGDTTDAHFMILQLDQGRSIWVKIEERNLRRFEAKARMCLEAGYTFDSFMVKMMESVNMEKFLAKHGENLVPVEEDGRDTIEEYYQDPEEEIEELIAETE